MSDSNPSRFFERLDRDKELARTYQAAVAEAVRASVWPVIVEVAAKAGLAFSTSELGAYLAQRKGRVSDGELSDEDLEGVSGGAWHEPFMSASVLKIGAGVLGTTVLIGAIGDSDEGSGSSSGPISP
jgi:hypothetical protein